MEVVYGAVAFAYLVGGAGGDGGVEVGFGCADGVVEGGAFGEACGYCGGEGAAGAVGVAGVDAWGGEAHHFACLGVVEDVDKGIVLEMARFEHYGDIAGGFGEGYGGVLKLVLAVDGLTEQQ